MDAVVRADHMGPCSLQTCPGLSPHKNLVHLFVLRLIIPFMLQVQS